MTDGIRRGENPRQIAAEMLGNHGYTAAYRNALAGAIKAQAEGDNYQLSIWREVKLILSKSKNPEL